MFNLLKSLYMYTQALRGRKLVLLLVAVIIIFLPLGIVIGKFTQSPLNKNELPLSTTSVALTAKVLRVGKVVYVNPNTFPLDKVRYVLQESSGKEILLASKDQKLALAEGLVVQISGVLKKSADGQNEFITVDQVIINSMEKN